MEVGLLMKINSNSLIISGLCPRSDKVDLNNKATTVNRSLKQMCSSRNIGFIDNSNIDVHKDQNGSRLHVNGNGDAVLARNLWDAIQKC